VFHQCFPMGQAQVWEGNRTLGSNNRYATLETIAREMRYQHVEYCVQVRQSICNYVVLRQLQFV